MNGKMSNPTPEQIEALANHLTDEMDKEELQHYVFQDLYHMMLSDYETFYENLEESGLQIKDLIND